LRWLRHRFEKGAKFLRKQSRFLIGILAEMVNLVIWFMPLHHASDFMGWLTLKLSRHIVNERSIEKNLRTVFQNIDDVQLKRLKQKIVSNFGRLIAELANIRAFKDGSGSGRLIAFGALGYPFQLRKRAVFVTGHFGNWELLPILLTEKGIPLTIVHTPFGHAVIDRLLMSFRRHTGATYVEKANALRTCMATLQRDESIALLVDQRVEAGLSVEFFGRPTTFTRFPARMAVRFTCPIIVVEPIRIGTGAFNVVFHEPIFPRTNLGAQAEHDLTQRMAKVIEGFIWSHPDQWFCNKTRWKKRDMRDEPQKLPAA
jgi:KDO2-lipid IV(A) lauroyltransferase